MHLVYCFRRHHRKGQYVAVANLGEEVTVPLGVEPPCPWEYELKQCTQVIARCGQQLPGARRSNVWGLQHNSSFHSCCQKRVDQASKRKAGFLWAYVAEPICGIVLRQTRRGILEQNHPVSRVTGKNVRPSAIQNCPRNSSYALRSSDSFGWHEDGHF